ncbi:hypothetical protein BDI4_1040029 [Burkholderia diffusa]|nr:hypothetical protein BDI4_1040029 [Burkholderia diffusa]
MRQTAPDTRTSRRDIAYRSPLLPKADFLAVWNDDAEFMKRRPGFVSTRLHRAIATRTSPQKMLASLWISCAPRR